MLTFVETRLFTRLVGETRQGVIWMLTIYAKNVVENISPQALRKIREEIENE
jgi:hypothetical protein